jgi:site-specific recombinase
VGLFFRKKESSSVLLERYFSIKNETHDLKPLSEIFHALQNENFENFVFFLKENEEIRTHFVYYIKNVFLGRSFNLSLTEANILSEDSFFPELRKRLLSKVLPPVEDENTVSYVISNVFFRDKIDFKFIKKVSRKQSDELFRLLEIEHLLDLPKVKKELLFSMNILAWRVIGNALEVDVLKMAPEYKNFDNPFLALQKELEFLIQDFKQDQQLVITSKDAHYKQIKIYLQQGFAFVNKAFKNASKYGISGKINLALLKIRQQLQRIAEILELLVIDKQEDVLFKSKNLVINILDYKSHRNNLRDLIYDSTTLQSHLITTHTAETGANYITSSSKEYFKMLKKASGGGIIVGALCVLKMLYSHVPGSDFYHAFLYSFNYAMGFIMIYLMNFTLATKQPAMTAATMARVLSEGKNTNRNYLDFAHLVSTLFRSQFIAFVGNVLLSFPVALAIIYGLEVLFGQNFAIEKSTTLLKDIDPSKSKAILHACLAGFYLFISGIIAGNVGNSSVFYKIPERIEKNPFIVNFFGSGFAKNLSSFYSRNWAGIMSNFWLGIFLGSTATIGKFFGLDLDIRHITFAAGNFALGLYGKEFSIDEYTFWVSFFTVFLIGFCNFIVSFGLSMFLAFRSRKLNFGEVRIINRSIFRYFLKNPLIFFLPIRSVLDQRAKKLVEETTRHTNH